MGFTEGGIWLKICFSAPLYCWAHHQTAGFSQNEEPRPGSRPAIRFSNITDR